MKKRLASATQISQSANIVLNAIMIILAAACLYPLLLVFAVSITDESVIQTAGYNLIPGKVTLNAYAFIFKDATMILRAYGVSIFITVVGSILSLIIISMYAYPLSRRDFRYKSFFTFIVFFTMLFNGGLVPFYMVYTNVLHLKNTLFAMILMWLFTPFYVLIMRTFYTTTIPSSVMESARIDGAGEFKIYVRIVLPLAKPALATIALFNILFYWNDWYAPLLFITDEKLYNLQYLMYRIENNISFITQNASSMSNTSDALKNIPAQTARMAMAIIAIGPIMLAYPFFQRYFVKGLTVGAVKG